MNSFQEANAVPQANKDIVPQFAKGKNEVIRLTTIMQLNELRTKCKDKMIAILFWALWYPESEEMRTEFERLAPTLTHIKLCWCDVDTDKEIIDEYEVFKVPYILMAHVSQTFTFKDYCY